MIELHEIQVELSPEQKRSIRNAYKNKEAVSIHIPSDQFNGIDILMVNTTTKKRFNKHKEMKKGVDIKLSKNIVQKQTGGVIWQLAKQATLDKLGNLSGNSTDIKIDNGLLSFLDMIHENNSI